MKTNKLTQAEINSQLRDVYLTLDAQVLEELPEDTYTFIVHVSHKLNRFGMKSEQINKRYDETKSSGFTFLFLRDFENPRQLSSYVVQSSAKSNFFRLQNNVDVLFKLKSSLIEGTKPDIVVDVENLSTKQSVLHLIETYFKQHNLLKD